ncbi:MAG: UDP-2,3-diacylglucosamine diphosphatase [Chitinophagaceae bacterium]
MYTIALPEGKKIYFLSDFHLGIPSKENSEERERKIVSFLQSIEHDADTVFFLGDIFDFWWEYYYVIPKGFIRLQSQWLRMKDLGIKMYYFSGNHDQWMSQYFTEMFNFKIFHNARIFQIQEHKFFIVHGDGLGPKDYRYKYLKRIFQSRFLRFLFQWIVHPDIAIYIANYFSKRSRLEKKIPDNQFLGIEREWLIVFCQEYLKKDTTIDFFVFGHRHLKLDLQLNAKSRYINLGDWISHFSYAEYDGKQLLLKKYNK